MKAVRTAPYLSPYNCPIEITRPGRLRCGAGWVVEMVMGVWGEWGCSMGSWENSRVEVGHAEATRPYRTWAEVEGELGELG